MISEKIKQLISEALGETQEIPLEKPAQKEHGDFATSIALKLAQESKKNPRELAEEIRAKLPESDLISKTEVAGPGFINFHLSKKALKEQITAEFKGDSLAGQKIMVEFAHPNTHKAFHIGHLRNICLGESLVRILESQGAEIFRANYQGDVGLHVAKCLWGYAQSEEPQDLYTPQKKAEFLGKVYAIGGTKFEEDEQAKKEIYALNKQIYARDPEIMPLWEKTREWSLEYFEYSYKRLGSHFDGLFFESQVYELGKEIVEEYLKKGIFEESEGAIIFPGEKHGLHNRVFITGEGNPVIFPWSPRELPDDPYAKLLFEMSSEMPDRYRAIICEIFDRDLGTTPVIRGMAFNADAMAMVKLLDIGTRQAFVFPSAAPGTQSGVMHMQPSATAHQ